MSNDLYRALQDAIVSLLEEENPLLPEELVVRFSSEEYAEIVKCFRVNGEPVDPQKYRRISHVCVGQKIIIAADDLPPDSVH